MSGMSLTDRAQMLTSSFVWGGEKTLEQLGELDWLKNISEYGILMYVREAERYGWVKTKCNKGCPNIYLATAKGRKMANERE